MNLTNPKLHTSNVPRLTVVSSYFYPKLGGLETIAYTTAKKLHAIGEYKVSIVTTNYEGKGYKKEVIDGMTVHRLPIWFKFSNTPINPMWYFWVKKIFKEEGTSLVHTHSPVPFLADIAIRVAKSQNIPTVATYHAGSMKKGNLFIDSLIYVYEEYFLRNMFKLSTRVVTVHQAFMKKNYPEFSSKTSFIPTGVDLNKFKTTALDPNSFVVTSIGRLERSSRWKGIDKLLQAMVIVVNKNPKAKLNLVGGGDAMSDYKKMADDLGISDYVLIPGPKYGDEVVNMFQDARVVVLPSTSDSEAFSVTLVEAMASGRPIIGTNIGGTSQVVENEKNGLLIPAKNIEGLADAILRILDNFEFAQKLGSYGAQKSKEFSWDIQVAKYNLLFKEILK